MIPLDCVVDSEDLADAIEAGYVRERVHPGDPNLRIYNYAEKAQYEKVWTSTTRRCRGLIVRDGQVVARPWAKFFNYGEHEQGSLDLSARVEVSDKCDGSLGILYAAPDGPAIATRGSFESEQAVHATELYRSTYAGTWSPLPAFTYLFEIVYPANRIVLDYSGMDDLILLGAVETATGDVRGPSFDPAWTGPRAQVFEAATLADALALPPRPNAEGLVVRFASGVLVKIKQDDYVALHRLVTGLSERSVWEHLRDNDGDYTALLASIPDEFHGWVTGRAEGLLTAHENISARAHVDHHQLLDVLPADFERREYALAAREHEHKALLFNLLDGRDISPAIWKQLRPVGFTPMRPISEDVA